jgi:hypothetical protein
MIKNDKKMIKKLKIFQFFFGKMKKGHFKNVQNEISQKRFEKKVKISVVTIMLSFAFLDFSVCDHIFFRVF